MVPWWLLIVMPALTALGFYLYPKWNRKQGTVPTLEQLDKLELQALRAHMNPIFIFNALNSIQDLILNNQNREASKYLSRFAKLIRLILDHSEKPVIPLARKIEFLKLYIEMEALRFDGRFNYAMNVLPDINTYEVHIPTMLIHPFVENAIWQGLAHKQGECELLIKFYLKSKHVLVCEVIDNGIGRAASKDVLDRQVQAHTSKTYDIVQERIQMLNKPGRPRASADVLDLYDDDGKNAGTRVVLEIPFQQKHTTKV